MARTARLAAGVERWLTHPRLPIHLALLAVVLCLPALGVGWQLDDHFHRLVLDDAGLGNNSPLEIFSLLRHGPDVRRFYLDLGTFPWWTSDDFRIAFLRHLSAATAWLDFRLWPDSTVAQHLHSLLWMAGLVVAAGYLYRRLHGAGVVAGLAALLFAIDDAHGTAAGWLANRNALVASLFGVLCLIAHDRWRRDGRLRDAVLAPLLLALGLTGGELALGTVAYLVAYALFLDPARAPARFGSLLPTVGVTAAWAVTYRQLGFGAAGSGLYVDPLGEPLAFAGAVADRAPLFLAGQLTPLAADIGSLVSTRDRPMVWWAAAGLTVLLVAAFAPLLSTDRRARFWAFGALGSVVPLCATFPTNRVLLLTGLGAMGLVAMWLERWRSGRPHPAGPGRWRRAAIAALLIATHLVLAPLLLPSTAGAMKRFGEPIAESISSLPSDPALSGQRLIIVNAPDYLLYVSLAVPLLHLEQRPTPARVRGLAIGPSEVEITRVDSRTLDAEMTRGYLGGTLGFLYREPDDRLETGSEIALADLTATVLATTPDGRPRTVRFRFDEPLESPALRWVTFENDRYRELELPAIGDTVALPRARGPFDVLRN